MGVAIRVYNACLACWASWRGRWWREEASLFFLNPGSTFNQLFATWREIQHCVTYNMPALSSLQLLDWKKLWPVAEYKLLQDEKNLSLLHPSLHLEREKGESYLFSWNFPPVISSFKRPFYRLSSFSRRSCAIIPLYSIVRPAMKRWRARSRLTIIACRGQGTYE